MNPDKKSAFLVWLAVQILVLAGWAGVHEWQRRDAPRILLKLAPVDPHDILRGRYQWIRYDAENVPMSVVEASGLKTGDLKGGERIWVTFRKGTNDWHEPVSVHRELPAGSNPVLRATYRYPWYEWDAKQNVNHPKGIQLDFGMNRYFIPASKEDLPRGTNVVILGEISVTRAGNSQIERLTIDGRPY